MFMLNTREICTKQELHCGLLTTSADKENGMGCGEVVVKKAFSQGRGEASSHCPNSLGDLDGDHLLFHTELHLHIQIMLCLLKKV